MNNTLYIISLIIKQECPRLTGRVSAGKALVSLNDVLDISGTVHVILNFAIRETALEEIWARSVE